MLKILELAQQPPRLTDLARRARLHLATTQRLVNVLVEHGHASRHANGYTAGPAALATAHAFATTSPLRLVARPVLEAIATTTELTASRYVRVQDTRVLIDRVEGGRRPQYSLPIGGRLPLYPGAAGKVFLTGAESEEPDAEAARIQSVTLADGTVFDEATIGKDLEAVSAQGDATSVNERQFGITAVAALITGLSGPTGALRDVGSSDLPGRERAAAGAIGARVPVAK